MSDACKNTVTIPDYDFHREGISKWLQVLFICQIAELFTTVLGTIVTLGSIAGWISLIISIAVIVAFLIWQPSLL